MLTAFDLLQLLCFALQWRHNGRDGVSNHQHHDCLLNRLFRCRSKKTSKLRVTGLCAGNSPVTGEFPAQRASNAENVSIWWRHHGLLSNSAISIRVTSLAVGQSKNCHRAKAKTSNGSWCIGIKGEMSGTVCVTFTWDIYIYIWVVYSFCLFCCLFIIVTWWYIWCIVWQVASKRKYRHVW